MLPAVLISLLAGLVSAAAVPDTRVDPKAKGLTVTKVPDPTPVMLARDELIITTKKPAPPAFLAARADGAAAEDTTPPAAAPTGNNNEYIDGEFGLQQ